jgi:hypothetical protein
VLYAELIYPFKTKPQTLTIIPPLSEEGWPAVPIGFIVYQNGVPVMDYRYLPESAKLNLDWNDPWYSRFERKDLKRWQESGLMIYLYVEPYEVRNEILVRVPVARPAVLIPKIADDKAMALLGDLLKNVYRAFDFREEEDVYDRLATSVHGDLLTNIYLQNRESMVVTQAGGAKGKVKDIDILNVSVKQLDDRPLALVFHSKWTAMGSVDHWGHIHTRKNQYEANITVEPVDGVWKITDLELLEEKRIDPNAKPKT